MRLQPNPWGCRRALVLGASLLVTGAAGAAEPPTTQAGIALVERFVGSPQAAPTLYRGRRWFEGRCDRLGARASMEVRVDRDERGFRYTVLAEEGSGYLRDKVFRRLLDSERDSQGDVAAGRADHVPANYAFEALGPGPDGLFLVRARPRRRDPLLVDGVFSLDPADGELRRVVGRLAKGPSFWVPRVELVREYGRVAGWRLPLRHESVAHLRLFGESHLRITYEYEMVGGRAVVERAVVASGPGPGPNP
jgi:hypothetical protein